ncbi:MULTISPECIES: amidohydrolase family protein [unclassified Bradyrhizobium]|uniref:metal-dependent hydrolase family protein n=1 Tax=unclassified Bradyrhizobium TaxID=2631580 RepID=UPI001CD40A11|nr:MULTISPECIES: amidohydrolase family protein [unclassified Bradyrhizobium]MCA1498589.1 amidohydrolase family protein [Bradyrhizobium sp. NBAIM14]MCA1534817.1 amidohydrolase family protein [Bradyrhizobium sp. NBAIM03]
MRIAECATIIVATCTFLTPAEPQERIAVTVFENVRIFDGKSETLSVPSNVVIRGNIIERIVTAPIPTDRRVDARVIQGGGRVLMPGLSDMHWHAMMVRPTPAQMLSSDLGYTTLLASAEATATLMRGFTTVRDMGGPTFSLKRAIDEGLVPGPRIYPSGAVITVSGGHGDFRELWELPQSQGGASRVEQLGGSIIADDPDEVRKRVREQLMQGAAQVKLTAGGGVASPFSPLDVTTFSEADLRAAVETATDWGTYVATHAYTPSAIRRSIAAGVKVIEHGHLMDEPTARLIAEKQIWLSTQPFVDLGGAAMLPPAQQAQMRQVVAGTDTVYGFVKKFGIKTAFGTDILFSKPLAEHQGQGIVDLTRWFTPAEALTMATSTNGELLALSGARNPYPGRIGVVEEGALADLLLVDGNPLEDIRLIEDPANKLVVIMKDGIIYKDNNPK